MAKRGTDVVLLLACLSLAGSSSCTNSGSGSAPEMMTGGTGGTGEDTGGIGGSDVDAAGGAAAAQGGKGGLGGARNTGGGGGANVAGMGGTKPSPDAGIMDAMPSVTDDQAPAGYVPAIVAVGYGGIRLLSRDNGLTWKKTAQLEAHGGDGSSLLVEVAWGHGTWIATYNKTFTSPDGINWTERHPPCSINRVAFGNGIFVGICGSDTWTSSDAIAWKKIGSFDPGNHTNILFAQVDKKFVFWSDDSHRAYSSADGTNWTLVPNLTDAWVCDGVIKSAKACGNAFRAPGLWLKDDIMRSTDGVHYTRVYTDDAGNYPVWFAWGWAPPQ